MGRNAGYIIALWCGIANGAEDILLPGKYDYDEQKLINNIINNRNAGKAPHHHQCRRYRSFYQHGTPDSEAATGIETERRSLVTCSEVEAPPVKTVSTLQ